MPDKYNFNEFKTEFACIEIGCELKGGKWFLNEEARRSHFISHQKEKQNSITSQLGDIVILGKFRVAKCRICSNEFKQESRRGRPNLKCEVCREKS